ncbi:MAG: PKD domain-containing protein [Sediminibacterium sp.]
MLLRRFVGLLLFIFITCISQVSAQQYLEFVENKGQWPDAIKYQAQTVAGAFALQNNGYRVLVHNPQDLAALNTHPREKNYTPAASENFDGVLHSHAYEVKFLNANPNPTIVPEKIQSSYNNYFIGNDSTKWASGCKIYKAVVYKDVYPGIDIRYYTNEAQLKYDIIVHPGGDVSKIALYIDGADGIKIKNRALEIKTNVTTVSELAPYSYQLKQQGKKEVVCDYAVKGNIVKFSIAGDYDKTETLVIDPSIVFYGYTGSTADNWGFTATYDPQGNFYAGGIVFGSFGLFPVSNGAFQTTFGGGVPEGDISAIDIGIMKFDPSGANRVYATYIGGKGNEQPHSLVVDASGNLIIAGRTSSGSTYPVKGLSSYGPLGGLFDIIVTKLNATGTALVGSMRIGGTADDGVNIRPNYTRPQNSESTRRNYGDDARSEVIVDGAGNIILASATQSNDFKVSAGAFQLTAGAKTATRLQDGVVIKMTPNLDAVIFSSYLGGNDDDAAFVLAINPLTGFIYVAGATASTDFPGSKAGVLFGTNQGNIDGFVTIISPDGTRQIATSYFGTGGADIIYGIQFDKNGFPYIMGTTTVAWPIINSPFNSGGNQANGKQFIAKLQPDLTQFLYSANFGTATGSFPNISPTAFLVDRCENVYVSGWGGTLAPGFPSAGTKGLTTFGSGQLSTTTDGEDLYFFVLERSAKNILYATFFGSITGASGPLGDHVDGGTSRFDKNGTIYQSVCSCLGSNPAPGTALRGTAGVWSPNNMSADPNSAHCNLLAIKLAFNLAGVGAGLKASIKGTVRDTSGCVPMTVDFTDTLAQGKSYVWDFGDGTTPLKTTAATVSHNFTTVGVYKVMLVAIDSSTCNIADTTYINMHVRNDDASLSFVSNKIPPCDKLTFEFDNTSTGPTSKPFSNKSFTWDFGDGTKLAAGSGIVTHMYAVGGAYYVKLTLNDTNYCNSPDSLIKQISLSPNVIANFTYPAAACAPFNAVFKNTSTAGQNFFWDFGDGATSTQSNPTHVFARPGSYAVQLIAVDPNTCNKRDTITHIITVVNKPTASYTYSPNPTMPNMPIQLVNTSAGAVSYKWIFGDGKTFTTAKRDTVISYQYQKTGTYNVCLVAFNAAGCSDTTCTQIDISVEVGYSVPNAFSPNGDRVNDRVFVRGFGISKVSFQIFNRWGELVFATTDINAGWDGYYKGKLQAQDVYHYTAVVEFYTGEKLAKKGDITLLR